MKKDEAIKYLQQLYPNGGHCWLDEQRIEAIDMAVKALQEEPVSIWHDSSEEPNDKSSCLIHYIVGGEVSYRDIFPVLYNKEAREFVSEPYPHPTGYKVEQSSLEGGVVAEVYKDMRDRFPISDIYKWAYIDDILNLSNVQRTVKNLNEDFENALAEEWKGYNDRGAAKVDALEDNTQELAFAKGFYRGWHYMDDDGLRKAVEGVSEELSNYINELSKQFQEVSFAKLSRIAVRVAKWQKENLWKHADGDDLPEIDREVIAILDNGKVVFAHRPPEYWDGKNIITGKVTRYYPKTYGKGGWNIPNVKWWLDVDKLPNVEE